MREDVRAKFPDEAESRGRGRRRRPGREPRVRHTRLSEAQRHAGSALIHTKTLRAAARRPLSRREGPQGPQTRMSRRLGRGRAGLPKSFLVLPSEATCRHRASCMRQTLSPSESMAISCRA